MESDANVTKNIKNEDESKESTNRQCPYCNKHTGTKKREFMNHLKSKHKFEIGACLVCDISIRGIDRQIEHIANCMPIKKQDPVFLNERCMRLTAEKFTCLVCGLFANREQINIHCQQASCNGETCDECGESVWITKALKHREQHLAERSKTSLLFSCDAKVKLSTGRTRVCTFRSATKTALDIHLIGQHQESGKRLCLSRTRKTPSLVENLQTKNIRITPEIAKPMSQLTQQEKSIIEVLRAENAKGENLQTFECTECNMKFWGRTQLQNHKERLHFDKLGTKKVSSVLKVKEPPISANYLSRCSICPFVCRTAYDCFKHGRREHNQEVRSGVYSVLYGCETCQSWFQSLRSFSDHKQICSTKAEHMESEEAHSEPGFQTQTDSIYDELEPMEEEAGFQVKSLPLDNEAGFPVESEPLDNETGFPIKSEPFDDEAGFPVESEPLGNEAGFPVESEPLGNEAGFPVESEPLGNEAGFPIKSEPVDPELAAELESFEAHQNPADILKISIKNEPMDVEPSFNENGLDSNIKRELEEGYQTPRFCKLTRKKEEKFEAEKVLSEQNPIQELLSVPAADKPEKSTSYQAMVDKIKKRFKNAPRLPPAGAKSPEGKNKVVKCVICYETLVGPVSSHIYKHKVVLQDVEMFKCPCCPMVARRLKTLLPHIKMDHPNLMKSKQKIPNPDSLKNINNATRKMPEVPEMPDTSVMPKPHSGQSDLIRQSIKLEQEAPQINSKDLECDQPGSTVENSRPSYVTNFKLRRPPHFKIKTPLPLQAVAAKNALLVRATDNPQPLHATDHNPQPLHGVHATAYNPRPQHPRMLAANVFKTMPGEKAEGGSKAKPSDSEKTRRNKASVGSDSEGSDTSAEEGSDEEDSDGEVKIRKTKDGRNRKLKVYTCWICEIEFTVRADFYKHVYGTEAKQFTKNCVIQCQKCKTFKSNKLNHVDSHNIKIHKGFKLACPLCPGFETSLPELLGHHIKFKKHVFKKTAHILCPFCDNKLTGGLKSMRSHIFSKHNIRTKVHEDAYFYIKNLSDVLQSEIN